MKILDHVTDLGVENPKFDILTGIQGGPMKLKGSFTISTKEKSIEIYKHFQEHRHFEDGKVKVVIFLQKPEHVFCKYADIMAANYERENKQ